MDAAKTFVDFYWPEVDSCFHDNEEQKQKTDKLKPLKNGIRYKKMNIKNDVLN